MRTFLAEVYKALKSAILGLKVTGKNMVTPAITVQYPDERLDLPVGYRGIPVLLSDAEGNLKCVSCELCARACPVECIEIQSHREEGKKIKVLDVYNLDATWCMYCGLCVEACPFDALAMSDQYELADYDLKNLVFDRDRLAEIGRRQVTETINFGIKTGGEPTR
ncbi:MAG TPA: NADH-quinone oxidoreductase subunit I [Limnochordia bacterium]|nr:NADH-quinone oxidoreductase subunit I [Limnochordia bacterium]